MFCPLCGTLSFPDPGGNISCTNYKCGYVGPAKIVIKGTDGEDVDLASVKSEIRSQKRDYEIIKDSDRIQGVLTKGTHLCPKCESDEVYSENTSQEFGEAPLFMLTCKNCGNGWRSS